jgi:hypothetical protein
MQGERLGSMRLGLHSARARTAPRMLRRTASHDFAGARRAAHDAASVEARQVNDECLKPRDCGCAKCIARFIQRKPQKENDVNKPQQTEPLRNAAH